MLRSAARAMIIRAANASRPLEQRQDAVLPGCAATAPAAARPSLESPVSAYALEGWRSTPTGEAGTSCERDHQSGHEGGAMQL
jgi:hypothetical protein